MRERHRGAEAVTPHLQSIFQNLAAAAIGGALGPAASIVWPYVFRQPLGEWANGPAANAIGAAAVLMISLLWSSSLNPLRSLGRTPRPKGDRLSIYVARFRNDEIGTVSARERIIASIRRELGPARVEVLPANVELARTPDVSDDVAEHAATSKARALLNKMHGDLLIWGEVLSIPGVAPQLELHFVSRETKYPSVRTFGFDDALLLDLDFGPEMGALLVARAVVEASQATEFEGNYLGDALVGMEARLRPLAQNPPESIRDEDLAQLLFTHGFIQSIIGAESGDPHRLVGAATAYQAAASIYLKASDGVRRAHTLNNLGNTLSDLGDFTLGESELNAAVDAYREAIGVYKSAGSDSLIALAYGNLGGTLRTLGERNRNVERFKAAVEAHNAALRLYVPDRFPTEHTLSLSQLGETLLRWSEVEKGSERRAKLEEARQVLTAALERTSIRRAPRDWAATLNALGVALRRIGELERGPARRVLLEEACAAFRSALKQQPRDRVPLLWATTKNNLGNALLQLGRDDAGSERLEQAVAAYKEALEERRVDRVPMDWAATQMNLGHALTTLGEREPGTATLEYAARVLQEAADVLDPSAYPHQHEAVQNHLKRTNALLAARRGAVAN